MKINHSIPTTMHAVQMDKPNDKLTLREISVPRPQAGQVLIRMAAAPINPSDLVYSFLFMVVVVIIGTVVFNRVEATFMDTV